MLFRLKRSWPTALAALAVLAGVGWALRLLLGGGPALSFSPTAVLVGFVAFGAVLVSDVTIHGLLLLLFGESYLSRHRELVAEFRGQSLSAILAGAAMAGLGEEVLFRGVSTSPAYLAGGAVLFGLLHHIRGRLWPFTIWATWQGVLFTAAILVTGDLAVTMTAHFLHDLTGFLIFRHLNRH
jgi:membrane protease YdiL (CAAX protease family)